MKFWVLHSLQLVYCPLACLPLVLQEDINDIVVSMKPCITNSVECRSHDSVGSEKESSEMSSSAISEVRPSIEEVETDIKAQSLFRHLASGGLPVLEGLRV